MRSVSEPATHRRWRASMTASARPFAPLNAVVAEPKHERIRFLAAGSDLGPPQRTPPGGDGQRRDVRRGQFDRAALPTVSRAVACESRDIEGRRRGYCCRTGNPETEMKVALAIYRNRTHRDRARRPQVALPVSNRIIFDGAALADVAPKMDWHLCLSTRVIAQPTAYGRQ